MQRPGAQAPKRQAMRPPPPPTRPPTSRPLAATSAVSGRASPADSVVSTSSRQLSPSQAIGVKRKQRDFEVDTAEDTNINVVVRCRARNEREVKENSGVVVSADGLIGKSVELSMGPNAISNKSYQFDKVFSSAADQSMVFDEVVAPILDEVLNGFNCTVFAYGQTGTGKTYTMSGDISDTLPIPDTAGIIPRVLHSLFDKLDSDEIAEWDVKCSFIELYNEELRDLLSVDESTKLKIVDDNNKKSHAATMVLGMAECHLTNASKGLEILRRGSHKRQVAATKCNDLSSRSHTVFTITVYSKRKSEAGEDHLSVSKLNLVDLAGSENIQRSGAENKRATEAGLINKSLLTLGRVINALVDKSSHIPYRESKLTRLLQDSLGGRTKTCIIATLSPAKSNLEETISTLDYAFRAKNIRNKPQVNQLLSKKTLLREFTSEIEKLKSELIATRQRNGVYLSTENYEELTTESESRRILSQEQRDKIDTLEAKLNVKANELHTLNTIFSTLKKDSESVRVCLDGTQDVLKKTEMVLQQTEASLREEEMLRKAHQATEEDLARVGSDLISTLGKTTADIGSLHSKIRRKSDLQSLNRTNWISSQTQVSNVTSLVQDKLAVFESQHQRLMTELSVRMTGFLDKELEELAQGKSFLGTNMSAFERAESEVNEQNDKARDDMAVILGEIKTLKEDVKSKVGQGLDGLSAAAKRISAGVINELDTFHTQLHSSYSALGKDFKHTFDGLVSQLNHQRAEAADLRTQLIAAGGELIKANDAASSHLEIILAEEKERSAADRSSLLAQMTSLVEAFGQSQDQRLESKVCSVQAEIRASSQRYEDQHKSYQTSMTSWSEKDKSMVDDILKARENVKLKIKKDWMIANEHNNAIQTTTQAVHEETLQIVDAQMKHLDVQLLALDEILSKVGKQNSKHHEAHVASLAGLATSVKQSYSSIGAHLDTASGRAKDLEQDFSAHARSISEVVKQLEGDVDIPLTDLRTDIMSAPITEYKPTGMTPQRTQYQYATALPRTESHERLLQTYRRPAAPMTLSEDSSPTAASPTKTTVFTDVSAAAYEPDNSLRSQPSRPDSAHGSLRELDVNVSTSVKPEALVAFGIQDKASVSSQQPPLKRLNTGGSSQSTLSGVDKEIKDFGASIGSKMAKRAVAEGRENVPFSASVGTGGRVLRSRLSNGNARG